MDDTNSAAGSAEAGTQYAANDLPNTVKVAKTFSLPGAGFCITTKPETLLVYIGNSEFSIARADLSAEKIEATAFCRDGHTSYVTGLVRCGDTLVSGSYDCSLIWWNSETGELLRRVTDAHDRWIRRLAASPDGTRIVSVADDMKTKVWDAATGECLATWGNYEVKTPQGFPSMLYAVACSPDGKWIGTGDRTGRVLIRNAVSGDIAATIETPVMYTWDPTARRHSIGGIRSLAFSADSKQLAVGGMGKVGNIDHLEGASRIEVFHWPTAERRFEIEDTKYKGLVESLSFGQQDSFLVAAGGDNGGFVSVYNMKDGKLLAQEKTPMHVHDFVLKPDGRSLTAVGNSQAAVVELYAAPESAAQS